MSTFSASRSGGSMHAAGTRGSVLARVVAMIEGAAARRRSRLALLEMTDAQLKDIGISRSQAYREASRPFWG